MLRNKLGNREKRSCAESADRHCPPSLHDGSPQARRRTKEVLWRSWVSLPKVFRKNRKNFRKSVDETKTKVFADPPFDKGRWQSDLRKETFLKNFESRFEKNKKSRKKRLTKKTKVVLINPPFSKQRGNAMREAVSSLKTVWKNFENLKKRDWRSENKSSWWTFPSINEGALWNLLCAIDWDPQSTIQYIWFVSVSLQPSSSRITRFWTLLYGEFDPGSEWTLAAWLRHASRTGH